MGMQHVCYVGCIFGYWIYLITGFILLPLFVAGHVAGGVSGVLGGYLVSVACTVGNPVGLIHGSDISMSGLFICAVLALIRSIIPPHISVTRTGGSMVGEGGHSSMLSSVVSITNSSGGSGSSPEESLSSGQIPGSSRSIQKSVIAVRITLI